MERLSVIYATALFDLALQQGVVDEFLSQAFFLRESLSNTDCQRMLDHPQISAADKHAFFHNTFAGRIHDDFLGFLYLVADKNRESYLLPALTALIELIEHHNRKVTARVLSATPFDEKQAESLRETLSAKLDKTVKLDLKVDPTIIGGPYIHVDGYYIDWTVKKKLRDLTVHMKEGCSA